MKFNLIVRQDETSQQIATNLTQQLLLHQFIKDSESPDIVISIGGDGTFLEAFHQYAHKLSTVRFMGLHTGHLGFFADWSPNEVDQLVADLVNPQQLKEVVSPLLEITITYTNGETQQFLSLNESTVKSYDGSTFVADVYLKDIHFESFRGDGLCLCTPSGSTAYNKALGGAIMHTTCNAMQLTEMASINNRVFRTIGSSLIIPKDHWCTIKPKSGQVLRVSNDHMSFKSDSIVAINYRIADEHIVFARFKPYPFWQRVRRAFIEEDASCQN